MPHHSDKVSADLIWEIARTQNALLVKRSASGGIRLSRDPLNLTNVHSRKNAGFLNEKAVGVIPAEKGGVTLITKKTKHTHQPALHSHRVTFGGNKSGRKTYSAIASQVAKSGYRSDLRAQSIARASAIRQSQKPVKTTERVTKLRGAKAKKAAAEKEAASA